MQYTGSSNFYGWYTSRSYTTKYDFTQKTTKDLSLYGKVYLDDLAIIRSQGTTQRISIDPTQFESLNISNVTYSSNITLSVTSTAMTAKYSFTHANGSSYKISYDVLGGKISAIFNQAAGVSITVDKYQYQELDLSSYTSENLYANTELNPKLETIAMAVAQASYEYIHNVYTSLHSAVVTSGEPDPDLNYTISATSPAAGKLNITTSATFYSLKIYDDLNNCIMYVTNTNKVNLTNLDMGTYRIIAAFDNNYSTYVLRQYVSSSVEVL